MKNEQLEAYFANCWNLYWEVSGQFDEVQGHCPIAYFGDREAFLMSSPRVLTVGLNPSLREFGDRNGERFPGSIRTDAILTKDRAWLKSVYERDLNKYFYDGRNPYKGWFNPAFQSFFSGLGASFYDDGAATCARAVHSDIFSPIATKPTWSGLPAGGPLRAKLVGVGIALWRQLVDILDPDIIVASMRKDYVSHMGLSLTGPPTVLRSVASKKGVTTAATQPVRLVSGKQALLVVGGAGRKPMNGYPLDQRIVIGEEVRERWLKQTS